MNEKDGDSKSAALPFDEEMCERYIFGELSPADRDRFEETYFSDDAFFERYIAVKTELLDLLARDELAPEKRSRMEPHFQATAPRRRRLEDTAAFTHSITSFAQKQDSKAAVPIAHISESEGFFAGLIASITSFFSLPKLSAAAVLLLTVSGALYFLDRSSSTNDGRETVLLGGDPILPPPASVVSPSPEPVTKEQVLENKPTIPLPSVDSVVDKKGSRSRPQTVAREPRNVLLEAKKVTPTPATSPSPSVNERSATGFALTLSTVGRDNPATKPAPTAGLNIGGQRSRQGQSEGTTQSIVLQPGATRDSGQTNTLVLRSGMEQSWAVLTLLFSGEKYPDYVVTITNMSGEVILKDDELEKRTGEANALGLWIDDTSVFKENEKDFIVTLEGRTKAGTLETIEEYYFNIRRVAPDRPPARELMAAEISGTVTGPDGQPVSKATVTARNTTTGMVRNILSLEDGTYRMEQLPAGRYEIFAEAHSLKKTAIKELDLTSADRAELPIMMEAGGAAVEAFVEGSESTPRIENLPIRKPRLNVTLKPLFAAGASGVKTIELSGTYDHADIALDFPRTSHSSYKATLRTISGKTVLSRVLRNRARPTLTIRPRVLRNGDYVIELRAHSNKGKLEPVAEFYFRVLKPD